MNHSIHSFVVTRSAGGKGMRERQERGALTRKCAEGDQLFLHTPEGRLVVRLRRLYVFAQSVAVELRFLRNGQVAFVDAPLGPGQHLSLASADGPIHIGLVRLRGVRTSQAPRAILR